MTFQEAVEIIGAIHIPEKTENIEEILDAFGVIKKEAEKQVPKKVINEKGWKYCPSCGECLNDDYGTRVNHCPECGTELDWSDNKEE